MLWDISIIGFVSSKSVADESYSPPQFPMLRSFQKPFCLCQVSWYPVPVAISSDRKTDATNHTCLQYTFKFSMHFSALKKVQLCLYDSRYEIYLILIFFNNLSLLSRSIQSNVNIFLSTKISVVSRFLFICTPHSLPYTMIYIAYKSSSLLIANSSCLIFCLEFGLHLWLIKSVFEF